MRLRCGKFRSKEKQCLQFLNEVLSDFNDFRVMSTESFPESMCKVRSFMADDFTHAHTFTLCMIS